MVWVIKGQVSDGIVVGSEGEVTLAGKFDWGCSGDVGEGVGWVDDSMNKCKTD